MVKMFEASKKAANCETIWKRPDSGQCFPYLDKIWRTFCKPFEKRFF